ncbi:MAG: ribose 5-phosphate isomerase B [Bacteroidota bacterium]
MSNTTFDRSLPIAIGADHAGFEYKEELKKKLEAAGWQVADKGTYILDSVDYPDFAHPVADMVEGGQAAAGILVCGSGNGVCMTANKHKGIRAALCWTNELAALSRQHNNANVICIPSRFVSFDDAELMANTFLATAFEGGRHERRVEKIC